MSREVEGLLCSGRAVCARHGRGLSTRQIPRAAKRRGAEALVHYVCLAFHHIASETAQIINV
jgi:hypothetical protein